MDPQEGQVQELNINQWYENGKISHGKGGREIGKERQIRAKSELKRALETLTVPIFERILNICWKLCISEILFWLRQELCLQTKILELDNTRLS